MRGASPQDIGHQVMTRMQPKIVLSCPQPPFRVKHAGLGARLSQRFNKHSFTTERLGQCSFQMQAHFRGKPGFEASKAKVD